VCGRCLLISCIQAKLWRCNLQAPAVQIMYVAGTLMQLHPRHLQTSTPDIAPSSGAYLANSCGELALQLHELRARSFLLLHLNRLLQRLQLACLLLLVVLLLLLPPAFLLRRRSNRAMPCSVCVKECCSGRRAGVFIHNTMQHVHCKQQMAAC
jgi:hypothetical protein